MADLRYHKLPNLVKSRHGVWYFRHFCAGEERRLSLRTKDWHTAKILAMKLHLQRDEVGIKRFDLILPNGLEVRNLNTDEDVRRFQDLVQDPVIQHLLREAAIAKEKKKEAAASSPPSPPEKITAKTKLFSEAVTLYMAEKKHDNSPKTLLEKSSTLDEFKAFFGDVDLNSIGAEQAISYKNRQISDGLSALRINKTIGFLRDFFAYSINNRLYFQENPFLNLNISRKSKLAQKVKSYEAFSDDDLKNIFENPLYLEYMNKSDYYWLPILALYSGARIEELASLTLAQIRQEDGIWFFKIDKAKNKNSVRQVPLHPQIIELGFLEYMESVKDKGGQLFPHLKDSINGLSKNCSRRFGQYLEKIKITDDRKVFHSFRSTFINRMTYLNTHPAILMAMVGHYEQSKLDLSSPHFAIYQKNKPMGVLKESLEKLTYGLNLPKKSFDAS